MNQKARRRAAAVAHRAHTAAVKKQDARHLAYEASLNAKAHALVIMADLLCEGFSRNAEHLLGEALKIARER